MCSCKIWIPRPPKSINKVIRIRPTRTQKLMQSLPANLTMLNITNLNTLRRVSNRQPLSLGSRPNHRHRVTEPVHVFTLGSIRVTQTPLAPGSFNTRTPAHQLADLLLQHRRPSRDPRIFRHPELEPAKFSRVKKGAQSVQDRHPVETNEQTTEEAEGGQVEVDGDPREVRQAGIGS
ncbi:uncharacterized protein LY89DRAFT_288295 [Mollisia scopiformis]|uniref:Uncharacterized protein n=1 Tax=Mollisia scopiformis TaxID=149040 RepID=A0A132BAL6_MOLSC|nr:uncharacterized protein LY89DRAFT_288295 [Mollisia scopiformis]KUJ09462.1 hypothetical protein LY89DRAFT_288295 [Mollisia scopiformis]